MAGGADFCGLVIWQHQSQFKMYATLDTTVIFLGISLIKISTQTGNNTCVRKFIISVILTPKNLKQAKYPTSEEWVITNTAELRDMLNCMNFYNENFLY